MALVSERTSTPIRTPSEKDVRPFSRSSSSSRSGFRKTAVPTGALRRESSGLSDAKEAMKTGNSDDEWDTDLEPDDVKEEYDVTGRTTYIQACRQSGVVPVSYFLRNMQNHEVDMKHHGLGVKGAKAIAISLVANTKVVNLNLSDNHLGPEGAGYIAEMLRENLYITKLDLSGNKLGSEGSLYVADILVNNINITHFTLSGNLFDDTCALNMQEALRANNTITSLVMSNNFFGEKGGLNLAPAIAGNSTIEYLDLSWNHLRNKGACAIALAFKENMAVKIVDLSWNGFANDGAMAMGEALKINTTLQELDLTNNRITAEGAVLLAKGLAANTTLKVLKIGKNPMQSAGAFAIVQAMKNNPSSALVEIELTDITVNHDFFMLLREVEQINPNIKISHGGAGGAIAKPKTRPPPMKILRNYIAENRMRLLDLFTMMDKDKSNSLSIQELADGLQETGVDLTYAELITLIKALDTDKNGEIAYSELVSGNLQQLVEDRRDLLKSRAEEERRNRILSPFES